MPKMDSPNVNYIDFVESYMECDNYGMDFACSSIANKKAVFYNSCWFKMKYLTNTFTDDVCGYDIKVQSTPYYRNRDYKIL